MSLLQKASIITTPTAYAEDYLYSIKPAIPFGDELIVNGNFYTNLNNWTLSTSTPPVWFQGMMKMASDGATFSRADQSFTTKVGVQYKVVLDKMLNTNTLQLKLGTSVGAGDLLNASLTTIEVHTFTITATTTTTHIRLEDGGSTEGGYVGSVSVKEITDADFDFTRASTGTRVNEDYLIEDVPYNLLTNSEDFSSWTNSSLTITQDSSNNYPNTSSGTYKCVKTGGGTSQRIYQTYSMGGQAGDTFTLSVYVKPTETIIGLRLTASGTASVYTDITVTPNIWQRVTFTHTTTGVYTSLITWIYPCGTAADNDSSTGGDAYIYGAQTVKNSLPKEYLKTTDRLDIPRIDYTNGEGSILLEPSRTNVMPYNQTIDTGWSKLNVTVADNQTTSPDGTKNAGLSTVTSTNADHASYDTVSGALTGGNNCYISCFVKKSTTRYLRLVEGYTNDSIYIDIDNATISYGGSATNGIIENYGNGWYRIGFEFVANVTGDAQLILYILNSSNIQSYAGNGEAVYLWGAQVEEGSYATSLIQTSGTAVTRSADAADNAGNSDLINSTEGVLYAEINSLTQTLGSSDEAISISDGTLDNRIQVYHKKNLSNTIAYGIESGNAIQFFVSVAIADISLPHKVAIKYKANDCALWIDGNEVDTQTSVSMPSGLNELQFASGNGASQFYGNAKSVMVFKEALTDLELEKLTGYNNRELYMNYYNRLSYLGLLEEYNVESDINNYIL